MNQPNNITSEGFTVELQQPITDSAPYILEVKLRPKLVTPTNLKVIAAKLNEFAFYLERDRTKFLNK